MASLYLSLQEPDTAVEYLRKSIALWHRPPEPADETPENDEDETEEAATTTGTMDTSTV